MRPTKLVEALLQAANLALGGQGKAIWCNDFTLLSNLDQERYIVVLPFNASDPLLQPQQKTYDCLVACMQAMDTGEGKAEYAINDAQCLEYLYEFRHWLELQEGISLREGVTYNTGYLVEGSTYSGATAKFKIVSNYSRC